MLEKKAMLGVAKDEKGILIVDRETKKGVLVPEEVLAQLTLLVWEWCDKMEPADIIAKLVGEAPATPDQKTMLAQFIDQSFDLFLKMGWAVKAGGSVKKEAPAKKQAPAAKKK